MLNPCFRINNPILLFLIFSPFILSCATEPIPAPKSERVYLVLEEVEAPPPEPVVIVEKEPEVKPLPVVPLFVQGRVAEVEVVQGVQAFIYLKFNADLVVGEIPEVDREVSEEELLNLPESFSLEPEMTGEIFSDNQFSEKAGDFVLKEKYGDIFKAEVTALNYIIDRSALVQVQIR